MRGGYSAASTIRSSAAVPAPQLQLALDLAGAAKGSSGSQPTQLERRGRRRRVDAVRPRVDVHAPQHLLGALVIIFRA